MDPIRSASSVNLPPAPGAPAPSTDAPLPRDVALIGGDPVVSEEVLERIAKQAPNAAEPLGLIVTAPDPRERENLKKLFLEKDPQNRITADLPLINGFAVQLDPNAAGVLPELHKAARGVRVHLDGEISIPQPVETGDVGAMLDTGTKTLNLDQLWSRGIKGKGVAIAVIDTGVAQHTDLKERIVGFKDFVNNRSEAYDDQGHGTHVAGIAAGDGQGSQGRYSGAAPEAGIVGVKVLDSRGSGSFSNVIAGIQWAVENKDRYGIKVLNLSLGGRVNKSYRDDPVAQAIEAAAAAGVVPAVAAGNSGPGRETISTPAHALNALTVGASDDRGTVDPGDDRIASFSSRGPTPIDRLEKPDVSAPGVDITAADYRGGYRTLSGTSMATPMVAGVSALLLSARPDLTPGQLKALLMSTANPLAGQPPTAQGTGVVDPLEAVDKPLPGPPPAPEPTEPPPSEG